MTDQRTTIPQTALARGIWALDVAFGLLPLSLTVIALVWMLYLPFGLHGLADFRQLYTGGYMIRTGHAQQLYDYGAQMQFQKQLFPDASNKMVLLITHPAFEELLFVPLSQLPYRVAFAIFGGLNLLACVAAVYLFLPFVRDIQDRWRWGPLALCLSFFPLSRALLQGQDSLLLLFLLSLALRLFAGNRLFLAGIALGATVFRFQIALPIAFMFLIWRVGLVCLGFVVSATVATAVSLLIVKIHGAVMYFEYILALSIRLRSAESIKKYADLPRGMMNVRGLISAAFSSHLSNLEIHLAIAVLSLLIIYAASRMRPSFPLAIIVASLVSYHFIVHDASIWLIPIFFSFCGNSKLQSLLALFMLFSPYVSVLPWNGTYAYLGAIPLLALFLVMVLEHEWGGRSKEMAMTTIGERQLIL